MSESARISESVGESGADSVESAPAGVGGGFGARVRSAVFWRSGSQILAQLITWGSTLVVIRLLDPADYGLFAMTQVILAFLSFLNGYGFASALVQAETVDPFRVRQAFGILLSLNALLAAMQFFGAPLAADYYGQPIVADLLRVQALLFLATPFIALPEVMMSRQLDFRRQAFVNLAAAAAGGGTALACAMAGYGVWTLVYAPIALFWTRAIGLTLMARLLVWPSFDFRGCGHIFTYGLAVLGSHFFWIIQTQADIFIAGRRFDPHALGLYAEALFLTQIFVAKFVPPLNEVAFPAYSRLQNDPAAVRWSFLKAVRLIMLIAAPVYCGMAVTAGPLVETLFGTKWLAMAPFVTIIALAMPFTTLNILFAPATNALGHPIIALKVSAAGALLFTATFFIASRFDLIGMAWGWLVASPIMSLIVFMLSRRVMGIDLTGLVRAVLPGVASALLMAIGVHLFDRWLGQAFAAPPALLHLALLGAVGVLLYGALLFLLERAAVNEVLALLLRRKVAAAPGAARTETNQAEVI